jgi:hypothetical protein
MNDLEERIKESVGKFLLDLHISKSVNEAEFEKIDMLWRDLAERWKANELVPKATLNELYMFVKMARAEVPYMARNSSSVEKKANAIEMTFDLILRGESHGDRRPGNPRII